MICEGVWAVPTLEVCILHLEYDGNKNRHHYCDPGDDAAGYFENFDDSTRHGFIRVRISACCIGLTLALRRITCVLATVGRIVLKLVAFVF